MALIRWEPARELGSFQNEVNRLFSTFFDTPTAAGRERCGATLDPGHGPGRGRERVRPQG